MSYGATTMSKCCEKFCSSIGRKYVNGFTGLCLVGFLIAHLIGNLTMFMGADVFNAYAHFLMHVGHGIFIRVAEVGLLIFFISHAVTGTQVALSKKKARKTAYYNVKDAGGNSKKTKASLNMIVTGIVMLVFVVLHLKHFKYGAHYTTVVHGTEMRDIYRLMIEVFQHIGFVAFYVFSMALMGMHLKHGVWSAIQSLGTTRPAMLPGLYCAGRAFGVLLALGFLVLPIIIYLFIDPVAATEVAGGQH